MHKLLGNFQANSRCFPKILHSWEKFYRTTSPTVPTNIKSAQLLIKYKSGALVTQYIFVLFHCHLYSFYLIVACLLGPQHLFQVDNPRPPNPCPLGRPHPLSEHPQNILTNLSLRELITLECAPTKSPTFFSQVLQVH